MSPLNRHERGEGKIGCILSLLVMLVLAALAVKAVPVFYADNNLTTAAEDLGSRAGILSLPVLEQQLRAKAAELEIPEALPKGAMVVNIMGDKNSGTCIIKLHFTRKIDLYGFSSIPVEVDKTISRPYMDAR